jgi:hypothetical protein
MTLAARSICDGRCWVSSSWTGRAPGPNRDDHRRASTVHGSRKSAGRVSFIYIITHLTVTFSSSSAVGATPRPATRRRLQARYVSVIDTVSTSTLLPRR